MTFTASLFPMSTQLKSTIVNVNVLQSNFISNRATNAAGIMVIHYNNVLKSHTTRIINATFKDNFSSKFCPWSDLLLLFHISSEQYTR